MKMWRKSSSFFKSFLLLFNLVFMISSIVLMSVGLIIRRQYYEYQDFLTEHYFTLPFLLICVSFVMLIITVFGCCGAIQENYWMISMFAVLLGILFIIETSIAFTACLLSEHTYSILRVNLNDTMQLYNKSEGISRVWDALQNNLHCCGMDSYKDWYPVLNSSLPMSCCDPQIGAIGQEICNENVPSLHHSSCLSSLSSIIKDNASTLGGVGIGIAIVQILGVIFSSVLAKRMRNNYENFK